MMEDGEGKGSCVCVCGVCVCVSNPVPKGIFILFCRLTFKQEVLHA